jgi:uncharacterized repeat protein (TIGR01451 family)
MAAVAALAVAALGLVAASPAGASHPGVVTLTVTRVVNIGDTGIEDFARGQADLYATAVIDGTPFDSKSLVQDGHDVVEPVNPTWTFSKAEGAGASDNASVELEIWDADDCSAPKCSFSPDPFGGSDDQGDINPTPGVDNINLVVDRTTGTWTGDTTSNCSTGDDTSGGDRRVMVCWDISTTSASGDADGDGLLDGWETNGLDMDGDGTIDLNLPAMGADPQHKDLFVEQDWEAGRQLARKDILALKAAFAAAPLTNPDNVNGVTLHVDTGSLVDPNAREGQAPNTCNDGIDNGGDGVADGADPNCNSLPKKPTQYLDASVEDPQKPNCGDNIDNDGDGLADANDPDCLVGDNLGGGSQIPSLGACDLGDEFYNSKKTTFDNANRRWVFRYNIQAKQKAGCDPSGGQGEIGGNDFITFNMDGGTIMHELGHTLNLHHGGQEDHNCKPNYVSVMNYDDQFGIQRNGGGNILDYSPVRIALDGSTRGVAPYPQMDEDNLDDGMVLDKTDTANKFVFVDSTGTKVPWPLNVGANWNSDVDPPKELDQDVNTDTVGLNGSPKACKNGTDNTLNGDSDWNKLSIPFRQFGDSADGAMDPETDVMPTQDELEALNTELNTTDLAVSIVDSPDPVAAGTQVSYTVTATNNGPNPSTSTQVVDTLPGDVTFASASPGCAAAAQVVTCNLGELAAHTSKDVTIKADVPANLVYVNGGPKLVSDNATVSNLNGPDSNGANDSDSETTKVVAVADAEVASVTTSSPLDVIIGQPSPASVDVTVANGGPSTPVDAVLSGTATAGAGTSVTPGSTTAAVTALAVGSPQKVTQGFTLNCTTPGTKTVAFDYSIALKHPEDVDPNLANNTGHASFQIDCVVPVAINIRPGGFPNSINLNTDATLAVLTTNAGEYGLPLAFDATTIDINTVRYGLRSNLFNQAVPTGAIETHLTNHLERSYELDDKTRDADLDGVQHYKPSAGGLTLNTTEACVKGNFTTGGKTYTFFGCDSVRVTP